MNRESGILDAAAKHAQSMAADSVESLKDIRRAVAETASTASESQAILQDILEAVRALKPAPVATARCSCTHEPGDSDCAVHPTCNECGADLSDHLALKPAPEADEAACIVANTNKTLYAEIERLRNNSQVSSRVDDHYFSLMKAEIERLQAELANRALTIGTLRDIIGKQTAHAEKLRVENAELKAACVDWQCSESNLKDDVAELKRFREREHKLKLMIGSVLAVHHRLPQDVIDITAAVRDFKLDA